MDDDDLVPDKYHIRDIKITELDDYNIFGEESI